MSSDSNNSGTDIDVLTNFQPIPKRFMVWDKFFGVFYKVKDAYPNLQLSEEARETEVFELLDLVNLFGEIGAPDERFETVLQSTNLFDKDGKEIFEGSIVKGKNYTYKVIFAYGGSYAIHDSHKVGYIETSLYKLLYHGGGAEVIGHILSNPELLEEK